MSKYKICSFCEEKYSKNLKRQSLCPKCLIKFQRGKKGIVYFAVVRENYLLKIDIVKIGFTTQSAKSRLSQYLTGCPFQVSNLYEMDSDYYTELTLHKSFQAHCIDREWFRLVPEIIEYIHTHCTHV